MTKKKKTRLGALQPKYRFFLNPYQDVRFTNCPQCDRQTKVRKHPFFIHIDPTQPMLLNMSGRYCPHCDLLILHQDKVEELLAAVMLQHNPELIGNEYLIIGTVERGAWREGKQQPQHLKKALDNLHQFKEVVIFEPEHYGWVPDEK
jgi:hypothetical protein